MMIRDMFADDINRKINGVIKVDQAADDVIEQELNEYVITRELKKHFITFFNYYGDAFDQPTADMGVWISGFFGSGKSHFLKMLSYLLENKEVKGIRSVERFRKKFEDDPATFMLIDRAIKGTTETILFNIDIEGFSNKDKTAVLRVFAKMFYNHLGFYGENLKVAMMERYIDQQRKTEEFRRVFEEKKGKSWLEMRRAFAFNGKFIIPTLMEVLDMSEDDAKAWFNDKTATEISIAQLVEDMKAYVDTKPANFRLLFMIDEVGQYVGTDTDMLLNLQSLTEKIGSECEGKIWVICTGQEAIDEIIKVRADEFSRIQARFKTRLSLSSSSVDEVIQKRILKKKPEAAKNLEDVYEQNDSVLRNLFSFSGSILDIKGYSGPREFTENFPFVPYQFIIMQKVFAEIRKHGNSGKHLSGGERSMLSGFQEAAQKIQEKDEYALVPFFRFYDTVHTFLDGSIRRVIERCQKAADNGDGIEQQDVDVLKLLYLIRYIDDIPSNLDNIVILMADDIRVDKIIMREAVRGCLDRLMSQNYIGRTGDTYNFLTDEEQDIQREIRDTNVDTASIVERIAQMIYGDIFTTKKFRYGKYDFAFDQMVDGITVGVATGGMRLRFLTVATDAIEKTDYRLMAESKGNEAIVVLADTPYYESLESAMKIRKSNGRVINRDLYFHEGMTWSTIASGPFGMRYVPSGFIFETKGSMCFTSKELLPYLLGLYNTPVIQSFLQMVSPTLDYHEGPLGKTPVIIKPNEKIEQLVEKNINLSRNDWDSLETSWDFQHHPLLRKVHTIAEAFDQWQSECDNRFNQLKANEEELNRIFIDIYGLQDELTPEVEDKDVTVRKADLGRDICSFISYAVGCMFGRYSLNVDGLVYAGGNFDSKYCRWIRQFGDKATEEIDENGNLIHGGWAGCTSWKYDGIRKDGKWIPASFAPDTDNIIPICDDEYFEDDIVGLFVEFVKTVYGAETLDENLKFIADALGGKGQPKDVIRNYFLNDFYKDHCKIYQKRPIYWLFDSGKKNGFKALIYMHRYQPDTIARIRTDYVHEQQARYRTAITDLEQRIANASTGERVKLNKKLTTLQAQDTEIRTYEEKIHHLADQMISIDLDDGVKKNYAIFQDVLAKIK